MCEHEWKWEDDWHLNYEVSRDSILIPQVCVHCGKKAYEVWLYSCVRDRDTYDIIA